MLQPHKRGASKIHSMITWVSAQAVDVNLLKYVVPCLIQNRQLKVRGIVCSPPSYVVETLERSAFIFHMSTSWVQSPKCSRGVTYFKCLSTLQAPLLNIMDLLGGASFFQPTAFYWDSNYFEIKHCVAGLVDWALVGGRRLYAVLLPEFHLFHVSLFIQFEDGGGTVPWNFVFH